jgi:acetyl esterase/lipase
VKGYDSICRDLALQTGYAVVFVEYTLAPEARYPTQQEQCYAVLRWVRENGAKKGLSQDKIAVVGDSAGCKSSVFHLGYERNVAMLIYYRSTHHRYHNPRINTHPQDPNILSSPFIPRYLQLRR